MIREPGVPETARDRAAVRAAAVAVPALFVNARFLTQDVTGVQRYAIELSRRLKVLYPNVRFLTPGGVKQRDLAAELGAETVGRFSGHLWEQLELPLLTHGGPLLSLCNTGPVVHPRQLVTLHDAAAFAVPEAYSPAFRRWYRVLFRGLRSSTRGLVTVSRFSQRELFHYCGVRPERLRVIGEGAEHVHAIQPDPGILEQHGLTDTPFLLAVGSNSPHKNFTRLVRALERLGETEYGVVIAGGSNPDVHAATGHLPGSVKHVGYVSDGELRALYEHAAGFVHPAYYEGFGIPPLEAMTLGCPVVASNAASIPEVCGDAALYFDPFDEADIAAKVRQFMGDAGLRERLRAAGTVQAERFSWDGAARELLGYARTALGLG